MKLDEAIKHCKEVAEENRKKADEWYAGGCSFAQAEGNECLECAEDHEQLAAWLEELKERREADRWIPIIMRPLTDEEQFVYPDVTFIFDCRMPENGQEILISTKYGVEFDTYFDDDGCYLDSNRDWKEVYAWRPLPKPYESEA